MAKENSTINQNNKKTVQKKIFTGKVVSAKMEKTLVVAVNSFKRHQRYGKNYQMTKKFKVHNPGLKIEVGATVRFIECRPLSKEKRWILLESKS